MVRYLKASLLAGTLIVAAVALTACWERVLPSAYYVWLRVFGLTSPYAVTNPVTHVDDQSDSSTVKAEVKMSANVELSPQQKGHAQVVFRADGLKRKPVLKNGSFVLDVTYQVDKTTGVGSASGTGRFAFKGRGSGRWCADFTATISDFGGSIKGDFHTTGGTGRVGGYSVKDGKIDATVGSDSVMNLTLSGRAKPQAKREKMPRSCQALSL